MKPLYLIILITIFSFCGTISQADDYSVYSDQFDHGALTGRMGAWGAKSLVTDAQSTTKPYKGQHCVKFSVDGTEPWTGVYVQTTSDWRAAAEDTNAFANLSAYKYLVIHARSDKDYTLEKIGFGESGETSVAEANIPLTDEWQTIVFELHGMDMKSINGLLLVVMTTEGTVYLDDVYYTDQPTEGDITFKRRETPIDPDSYYVYADSWIHGIPSGYMGDKDGKSIEMDDAWRTNPYEGPKCIKITIKPNVDTWRGLHVLYTGGWNESIDESTELPNLTGYDKMIFYARSDNDEPMIIPGVGVAGAGGPEKESRSISYIEVDKKWRKFTVHIKGAPFERINSLFYLTLPEGTLYLDEIRFINSKTEKNKKKNKKK